MIPVRPAPQLAGGTLADINNATLTINSSGLLGAGAGNVASGASRLMGSSVVP